jgi:hypothetical protein
VTFHGTLFLPRFAACPAGVRRLTIPIMGRRKTIKKVRPKLAGWIDCRSAWRTAAASVSRGWAAARLLAKRAHWRWRLMLPALIVSFRGTLGPGDLLLLLAARAAARAHSLFREIRSRTRMAS